MKKISALSLITVILMCLFCIPVEATNTSVNVSATSSVNAENNVSVTISWAETAGTAIVMLNYDSSVFEYVSNSANCQGGYAEARNLGSSLKIGAFGTSFKSVTMQFKAKSGTEGKTGSFNITSASLTDTSDKKMTTTIGTTATVKVNEKKPTTDPTTPPVTETPTNPTNPTNPPETEPTTQSPTNPTTGSTTGSTTPQGTSSTKKTSTATGTKKATTTVATSSNNNVNTTNTNTASNEVNNKTTNETKKTNTVTSKNKKSNDNNTVNKENVVDDNNEQKEKKTNIVVPIVVGVIIVMAIVLVVIRIRTME